MMKRERVTNDSNALPPTTHLSTTSSAKRKGVPNAKATEAHPAKMPTIKGSQARKPPSSTTGTSASRSTPSAGNKPIHSSSSSTSSDVKGLKAALETGRAKLNARKAKVGQGSSKSGSSESRVSDSFAARGKAAITSTIAVPKRLRSNKRSNFVYNSGSSESTTFERTAGPVSGEVLSTFLGQGTIFNKIHGRAGTNVSSAQGNHITASVVLNEIVYNFLEDKSYRSAMAELPRLLSCLGVAEGEKGSIEELLTAHKTFLEQAHLDFEKEERHKLVRGLKQIRDISSELRVAEVSMESILTGYSSVAGAVRLSEDFKRALSGLFDSEQSFCQEGKVAKIKESLKYARRAANATIVTAISEKLLEILNKQKDPPSALPLDRDKHGCHLRGEKAAMKGLRLFNCLCILVKESHGKESSDKLELLNQFKDDVKLVMRYSVPNISSQTTINDNFHKFMTGFFGGGGGGGDNFVERGLESLDVSWLAQVSEALESNVSYPKKLGEHLNDLYDFGYVEHRMREQMDEDEEVLHKSSARHICYAFSAFSGLKLLPQGKLEELKDEFFDQVLKPSSCYSDGDKRVWTSKGQGWGDRLVDKKENKMNREHLKKNTEIYIDNQYNFCPSGAARAAVSRSAVSVV